MPRDIPIGNGRLLVSFDLDYRIRDFYYPRVGKENHALGFPWRLGLWVSGRFLAKPNWHIIGLSPLAAEILADPRGTFVDVNLIELLQPYRIEPDFSDLAIASTGASFRLRSVASPLVRSGWYTPVADADRKLLFRVLNFDVPA